MTTTFRELAPDTVFRFATGSGFSHLLVKRDPHTAVAVGSPVAVKPKPTDKVLIVH